jgi:BA14K-like protein
MRHVWAVLLISAATLPVSLGMSRVGVAQTSEPQPRFSDDGPPPGGCNPIGVTVSGEIVFPMTCKDFIERHKAADRAASAAETKPATAEASKAPDAVEAGKALTTGEGNRAPPATAGDSSGRAAVEGSGKAPMAAEAITAPAAADPGKPDEKDAKPAEAAKAAADEAAPTATRQVAVAPAAADTVKSSAEPATTAALSKRTRARTRVAGSPGCTRFRTYDAASGTYRDFGGHRRPCP